MVVEFLEILASSITVNNTIIAGNTGNGGDNQANGIDTMLGINLLSDNPLLAPLGDYGGSTQTMIPLPGSPAINAAIGSTRTTDQRSFAITDGLPDIGAVELNQGDIDLLDTDNDGDGNPFLLELTLGTAPFLPDSRSEKNLTITFENDISKLTFGNIGNTRSNITLHLQRSTDLVNFDEILFNSDSNSEDIDPTELLQVEDPNNDPKAFYRLEAELNVN